MGKLVLNQTDQLSRALQSESLSAAEGFNLAQAVTQTLEKDRCEKSFDLYWESMNKKKEHLNIDEPILPRQRKLPKRFDQFQESSHFPNHAKDEYRRIYLNVYDNVINRIKERFDQPDFSKYRLMQDLIFNALDGKEIEQEVLEVTTVFTEDFNADLLQSQLKILPAIANEYEIKDIKELVTFMQSLTNGQRLLIPQVVLLMKFVMVLPATNAISERAFSTLRRVKSYCRATTLQQRLNHLMILHVYKDHDIDLVTVANEFVCRRSVRKSVFGVFTGRDILKRRKCINASTQTVS